MKGPTPDELKVALKIFESIQKSKELPVKRVKKEVQYDDNAPMRRAKNGYSDSTIR